MAAHLPDPPGESANARVNAFRRLFDLVPEGAYVGVLGRGIDRTAAANPHLRVIFGCAASTPDDQVRPFDPARFVDPQAREAFLERLAHDGRVTDYLLRLRRSDGSIVWIEVTARAEVSTSDGALRVKALIRDVSERKKVDDQAKDLYHQALQAEKLASLGQTVSGVAHELNNPLASILSWAERLSGRPLDDPTKRGLDVILHEAERAARTVRNLLTFARKRHTTRTMVDMNHVVRETLAVRAYEQRVTNIRVIDALAAGLPPVFADAHQLQQVLLNLIINAEQAMLAAHGRGTIVIRTWHDAERESVVLEVNDDGPGVPEEVRSKIFDPFFTTKEVGKGTGLGLAVSYAIVQEHRGRIWVDSGDKGGASFFVELPVGEEAARDQQRSEPPQPAAKPQEVTVLIVEDEPALAAAVADGFADAGFVVDRAGDGEEGLARVARRAYELIVCDLKMPRVDGIQFYRAIAAANPALARRIVFVTGDVVGTDAERFLDETGCRWLPKPFRLADLLRVAREVIA
ncbi:MAG: response regulator [Planctomycetes bacterium]|nr:response regulator [Planctomycetota bacterium]